MAQANKSLENLGTVVANIAVFAVLGSFGAWLGGYFPSAWLSAILPGAILFIVGVWLHAVYAPTPTADVLLEACDRPGNIDEVVRLIKAGAPINGRSSPGGETPLSVTAVKGDQRLARFLLENGADVNNRNVHGNTPLMFACSRGDVDLVRLLIDHRADIAAANEKGITAAWLAVKQGHVAVLRVLMSAGLKSIPRPAIYESDKIPAESDPYIIETLAALCSAYASDAKDRIAELEPIATELGQKLQSLGGIVEMRRIFYMLPDQRGRRTLEMHWDGIGAWRG